MYRKIRSILREPRLAEDVKRLLTEGTGFDAADIDIALAVFEELRLISRYNFDGEEFYQFQMVNKKDGFALIFGIQKAYALRRGYYG